MAMTAVVRTGWSVRILAVFSLIAACADEGADMAPVTDASTAQPGDSASEARAPTDSPAVDERNYAVCLADTSPTFTNLRTHLFPVSCAVAGACHLMADATSTVLRGGGGLDLETDVYVHLLGANGMGASANNQEGALRDLIRVKPGDPDGSFLLIKLQLTTTSQDYGTGMPFTAPGSVCPATLSTIRNWILQGAPNN
jgi:hypothetical protein